MKCVPPICCIYFGVYVIGGPSDREVSQKSWRYIHTIECIHILLNCWGYLASNVLNMVVGNTNTGRVQHLYIFATAMCVIASESPTPNGVSVLNLKADVEDFGRCWTCLSDLNCWRICCPISLHARSMCSEHDWVLVVAVPWIIHRIMHINCSGILSSIHLRDRSI